MFKELKKAEIKAKEIYERAIERKSFSVDLQAFRRKYDIPEPSKVNPKVLLDLLDKYYLSAFDQLASDKIKKKKGPGPYYLKDRIIFLQKYGFPSIAHGDAMEDLLLEKIPPYCPVDLTPISEVTIEGQKTQQISIQIDPLISQLELIEYIKNKDNWKKIKNYMYGFGGSRKNIKGRKKREEDRLILELWPKFKGQKYPEIPISTALKKYGIMRSPDAIKKAYYSSKKRIRNL